MYYCFHVLHQHVVHVFRFYISRVYFQTSERQTISFLIDVLAIKKLKMSWHGYEKVSCHMLEINHTDSLISFESFRTLRLSKSESCRALKFY